jgi:hypothetical protein
VWFTELVTLLAGRVPENRRVCYDPERQSHNRSLYRGDAGAIIAGEKDLALCASMTQFVFL